MTDKEGLRVLETLPVVEEEMERLGVTEPVSVPETVKLGLTEGERVGD